MTIKVNPVRYSLAVFIAILTFLVYSPALKNDFVNWDDNVYVLENPHIRSLDLSFFKWAFFDFYASNWHPLTWISHAIDYAIWGLNPIGHHLTNNILHSLNTFLVVLLVVRLIEAVYSEQYAVSSRAKGSEKSVVNSKKEGEISDRPGTDGFSPLTTHYSLFTSHDSRFTLIAAGVTGLLFGLHPIHVESVAWVAERKDLLCALFYLLSVLAYVKNATTPFTHGLITPPTPYRNHNSPLTPSYLKRGRGGAWGGYLKKWWRSRGRYFLPLLFFTLALLSKPMAVTLPFVLLILDWYPLQKITSFKTFRKSFIEKLPFIVMSIGSSILTILAQQAGEAIKSTDFASLSARLLVAGKSLITYLPNMILPFNLTPFYPYPHKIALLSVEYFIPVALIMGLSVICILTAKKQKLWLSVWGYYSLTLMPVLGLIQVGDQAMADRYTYLPSLGPFLLVGLAIARVMAKKAVLNGLCSASKLFTLSMAIFVSLCMSYLTIRQTNTWENSFTLWNFIIEKNPDKVPFAYYNRGLAFAKIGQYQRSIEDFNRAIFLRPFSRSEFYNNRGVSYMNENLFDKAIEDFQTALTLDPNNNGAYYNRGLAYYRRGSVFLKANKEEFAITDFRNACNLGNKKGCYVLGALGL